MADIDDMIDGKGFYARVLQAFRTTSHTEIARRVGLTKHALTHWKKGKIASLEHAALIAALAGVSLDWLVTGKGDGPKERKLDSMDAGNVALTYANSHLPAEFVKQQLDRVGGDLAAFGKLLAKLILLGAPAENLKEGVAALHQALADAVPRSDQTKPKRKELTRPVSKKKRRSAR